MVVQYSDCTKGLTYSRCELFGIVRYTKIKLLRNMPVSRTHTCYVLSKLFEERSNRIYSPENCIKLSNLIRLAANFGHVRLS